jgi:hypothetical protein
MIKYPYRQVVGTLLHIAITARPDISTAISMAGRYSHNPAMEHWEALLNVIGYLERTSKYVLSLGGLPSQSGLELYAYADSDWAGDENRNSRSGIAIYLNNSLITYVSKLQTSFALSTMEAETNAGCSAAQYIVAARLFLEELGFKQKTPTILFEDNSSCITINSSWKKHPGARHYEVKQYFLRSRVVDHKDIELVKLKTTLMIADMFTKQLSFPLFAQHRHNLGIHEYLSPSQGSVGNQDVTEEKAYLQTSIHPNRV